ncbi:hypothetical protein [Acetobacter papayae]|uniref:hypothetical protein n=1 Tax=Acetobacter papayae TaxID=1076592 RepID=UPI000AFFE2BF|nr:hypothetical protein [Acetobacter papayae]
MSATLEHTQPAAITAEALAQFIGTTRYYRYTMGLLLTDGAAYLPKMAQAGCWISWQVPAWFRPSAVPSSSSGP